LYTKNAGKTDLNFNLILICPYTVYADGGICLDILQNQWSPIYDASAVLTSIQSLLSDPNPNSPANSEAARLYVEDRKEYNRRVKEVVETTWIDDGDGEPDSDEGS